MPSTLKIQVQTLTTSIILLHLENYENERLELIAIIETLKALARNAKNNAANDNNIGLAILFCCLQCILQCIGDLLEYFNKYAFTQVAIYGKDYCQAAKDTWELFKSRGFDAIINDNFVGTVLGFGSLMVGILNACIALAYVATTKFGGGVEDLTGIYVVAGFGAFLIAVVQFSILAAVIDSGVTTTFVCL